MKILMMGLGGIGQRHLRNLRTLLGISAEISAYDPRGNPPVLTDNLQIEQGADLAQKYQLRIFTDLEQALTQKPEIAFICNPTSMHVPMAIRAAQEGCHLFIEKPLSDSLEHVDELVNLVETRNVKAVLGYQMRFHPCLKRLHELIQERKIGRVLSVRADIGEYLPGWHTYEDYRQMYASRRDLGGGVILSQIHEFDYLYWLFGFPCRVFSLGGHLSSLEVDVEDTADILMECSLDGHTVPVSLHQDYLQRPPSRRCEVIGDAGKILADLSALKVDVFNGQGNQIESQSYEGFQRNRLFLDELEYFLEYVKGEPAPLVDLQTGVQSLRIALAARESLETGKVVELSR
jgi:predicted dehydrogenase